MLKRILLGIVIVLILASAGFVIWASLPLRPSAQAGQALTSSAVVRVSQDRWLVFTPQEVAPETGFIFYPGGRVDYRAYAPLARSIAADGFLVVIVPMPLNLAVFSPNAAQDVIAAFPEIRTWAVGGHSLGGAMAASFTSSSPNQIDGLVLLASYPAASADLSGTDVSVISIYATEDGLADVETVESSARLLPPDTQWVRIVGGNHAQFGDYGPQPRDNPASISPDEQLIQTAQAISSFLRSLPGRNAQP
jgi:pimeloyl-ACP methyl ester carboxylesterase